MPFDKEKWHKWLEQAQLTCIVKAPDSMLIAPPVVEAKLLIKWQLTSCSCATVIAEELPQLAVLEALNSSIPTLIAPPVCA